MNVGRCDDVIVDEASSGNVDDKPRVLLSSVGVFLLVEVFVVCSNRCRLFLNQLLT